MNIVDRMRRFPEPGDPSFHDYCPDDCPCGDDYEEEDNDDDGG